MFVNSIFTFLYKILVSLFSIWLFLCQVKDRVYDYTCDDYDVIEPIYDFIVIGAGTAGSTVALRLAERTKSSILLIEAGQQTSFPFNIPVIAPLLQKSEYDWQYETVPQDYACLGLKDQKSNWPMGRIVGGTSALNNLIYKRGHWRDYDAWAAAGNPSWGYNEGTRDFFRRSEKQDGDFKNDSLYHGTSGLWTVNDLGYYTALSDAVLSAGAALGYPVGDLNGATQVGFMRPQVNMVNGARFSLNHKLLQRMRVNPRLTLLTGAVVEKIVFSPNNRAVGVRYHRFGSRKKVRCRKSIIVSAGTIGTPKILMMSGVGPKTHLQDLGIRVRVDLPVGRNLQDHVTTGVDLVLLDRPLPTSLGSFMSPWSALGYFASGTGPWTFPGCEVIGLVHSRYSAPWTHPPDIQLMVLPAGITADGGVHIRKAMGISDKLWDEYFAPLVGRQTASILPVALHPQSRGEVRLRSRHYLDKPVIDPRYLTEPKDVAVLYEGIQLIKRLIATDEMQALGARLYEKPLPGCEDHVFDSVPYWECYIRHLTLTSYHPVGTCKMGPRDDPTTVVDPFLRVHGTYGLRVMDASVMPTLPSGNPNAAVAMIAEKGTDMLLTYWQNKKAVVLTPPKCHAVDVFVRWRNEARTE